MHSMTHNFSKELLKLERDSHDTCSSCKRVFIKEDLIHSGYDAAAEPLYVGECCSNKIKETASRYHYSPRPFVQPPETAILWRYMGIAKFIAMLKDQAVFFTRVDRFEDPFECAKGLHDRKHIWDDFYYEFFKKAIKNPPPGFTSKMSADQIDIEAKNLVNGMANLGDHERRTTFVNCWHENEHESEAMWKLYSDGAAQNVAIQSRFSNLKKTFNEMHSIQIGRISYIDFNKSFVGPNESAFRKRKSFEHENEVRAMMRIFDRPPEYGSVVPVNLDLLIDAVFVSPLAPPWFENVVVDLLEKFGLNKPVKRSSLESRPFYG